MVEIKIESPWKEKFFVVSRILGCVLLIMTIIFYIHRDFCDIVNFYFGLVVADEEFWDMLTAIFTGFAAICAFFAYMQSIRIREHSSFDAVFTQLLGSLQSFINNKSLQETKFKQNWWMSQLLFLQYLVIYNRHYDVFLNFCNIYKSYSKSKAFSKLDENEIRQL